MPTIGVGVFIIRRQELRSIAPIPPKILIGRRSLTNKRAPGVWALPGGMREQHETLQQCAEREVFEETGLRVVCNSNSEFQIHMFGISDHHPREDHLTTWAIAHQIGWNEPKVMEPEKCDLWEWKEPAWIFKNVPQDGEQAHWTPYEAWRVMLCDRLQFPLF